jgi:hypothetical protein
MQQQVTVIAQHKHTTGLVRRALSCGLQLLRELHDLADSDSAGEGDQA